MADCSLEGRLAGYSLTVLLSLLPGLKKLDMRSNNHLKAEGLKAFADSLVTSATASHVAGLSSGWLVGLQLFGCRWS